MQPTFELAHVLRAQWKAVEQSVKNNTLNTWQLRTLSALSKCRTSALGGHIDGCTSCGNVRISYNSCRNRHCPKCQGNEREAWIQARQQELLPVSYFHVVFTLYLFPVKALSKVFPAKYIHHVRKRVALHNLKEEKQIILPKCTIDECFKKKWVVYAKKPFGGVDSVVEYLGSCIFYPKGLYAYGIMEY